MKVKLDENIPDRLVAVLEGAGHGVDTVASEGHKGKPDGDVWRAVRSGDRFLITQDLDFSDGGPGQTLFAESSNVLASVRARHDTAVNRLSNIR